jgi:trigger factor
MQVTIEELSSVKKTLHVEIPQEQVTRELDSAYSKLKKTAKIKGFRPGKAPRSVLERMFRKDVHADVSSKLIQESFINVLKDKDLKIVGNPQLDPPELTANEPYAYDATVEVKPDIGDIDFKGLKLNKTQYKVNDKEVESQLKALQKNMAQQKTVEDDRPAQEGDHVMISYEGLKDGKPFTETQRTENFTLKIGDGSILKDFDTGLIGMKAGDSKEIKVKFPDDYFNDKLAGLDIDFQVTLNQIREEELPEIDDDLAQKAGNYSTLVELKERIRQNLTEGYTKRVEQEMNEQIFTALIEKKDFDVPDVMVDFELDTIVDDAEKSFAYRNTSLEEMGITRESIAEKYRDTAVKQVKRHLILEKIIEQENLTLSEEQLQEGLQEMADAFQQPVEQIKAYYSQNTDKLDYFKQTLLEKRAINLIIESGVIKEIDPPKEESDSAKPDRPAEG